MEFLQGFLGAIIGITLVIVILIIVIVSKIKKVVGGSSNFKSLLQAAGNAQNLEIEEYSRVKDVAGMTRLLEPTIIKDFPDFNKDILYNKVETILRKILNAIEQKNYNIILKDDDLRFVFPTVKEKIEDLKSFGMSVKYDAVNFHKHAIKSYEKRDGIATVTISSTLEYYYEESSTENKKLSKNFKDVKKQTRYTTKFVYVYDEAKQEEYGLVFGISCPNCGAPLKRLDIGTCEYCSAEYSTTHLESINLKIWKMSSYKEDYN